MAGDDSFLSRWARRKNDARLGNPLEVPEPPKPAPLLAPSPVSDIAHAPSVEALEADTVALPPALTLDDANALQRDSDFKPFMAQQVQPEVRNAAMKKLFADPHYNVMDGLDTYIDDYTLSDPIPETMLRQMVGAQFLKLFDHALIADPVAQSTEPALATEPLLPPDHANTHLRLQPDHAPADPVPGSSAA